MSGEPKLSYKSGGLALITQVKGADGDMVISGLGSPFGGPPDEYGDIIDPGAYFLSLQARPTIPVLWQHDMKQPIGKTILLAEDDIGLVFKAKISPVFQGLEAWQLIKDEIIQGISIGYTAEKTAPGTLPGEARRLKTISLYEISVVTFPAASRARVTAFASSPNMGVLRDALTVAEGRDYLERKLPIPQKKLIEYIDAEERSIERKMYGGKTLREAIYDLRYELQKLGS